VRDDLRKRGEDHPKAKLSDAEVRRMRAVHEARKALDARATVAHMARLFNVSFWTARDILQGRTRG
jgi:hypothetical protein